MMSFGAGKSARSAGCVARPLVPNEEQKDIAIYFRLRFPRPSLSFARFSLFCSAFSVIICDQNTQTVNDGASSAPEALNKQPK